MVRAMIVAAVAMGWLCAQGVMAAQPGAQMQEVGQSVNGFGVRLYQELARAQGNVFFSPASVHGALAMTMAGARGQTAQEMQQVLGVQDAAAAGAQYRVLAQEIEKLRERKTMEISIANSLWGQSGVRFEQDFLRQLAEDYGSELRQVTFRGTPELARRQINDWVSEKTNQRIKDLVAVGVIRPETELILVNAIYFKAQWADQFEKGATRDGEFWAEGERSVQAKMMHQTLSTGYAEDEQMQVLELRYRGGEVSMFILLPRERAGLKQLEQSLSAAMLAKIQEQVQRQRVEVTMPRFKVQYKAELAGPLASAGMPTAFGDGADLSGMIANGSLRISNVIHQAFVTVDEEGTEAAAATAVGVAVTAMPPQEEPVRFTADHPFVFAIMDRATGAVLFMGSVSNPVGE